MLNASSAVNQHPESTAVAAPVGQHQLPTLAQRIPSAPVLTSV